MSYLNEPLGSVIIPTCDRPKLLKRAVKSVFGQNYSNFEVIIVDDSVKSSAKEVLEPFPKAKLKYVRLNEHGGGSVARNVGIQIAKGDFIAFLDDDDEYLPNFLGDLVQLFQNAENVQMAMGKVILYNEVGQICMEPNISIKKGFLSELIPIRCVIPLNSFILKKQYLEYFDISLPCYQDVDLIIQLAKRGIRFKYTNIPVSIYHCEQKRNRITVIKRRDIETGEILLKKHKNFLMNWPLFYATIIFNHSRKYSKASEIFLFLKDSLPIRPFTLRHWVAFFLIASLGIIKRIKKIIYQTFQIYSN